jgi:RNA polymerase sigma-70 factor (ECF subfamily)
MAINVEELYKKYGPMVYRRCKQILYDDDTAADVMQEVFITLLRKKNRLHDKYPSSLLYTIATNLSLNHIRNKKRKKEVKSDAIIETIASCEDIEQQTLNKDLIHKIFQKEPASTKSMAYMHLVDKMTLQEVARLHNLSVSGVRKRLRTLKFKIKELKEI